MNVHSTKAVIGIQKLKPSKYIVFLSWKRFCGPPYKIHEGTCMVLTNGHMRCYVQQYKYYLSNAASLGPGRGWPFMGVFDPSMYALTDYQQVVWVILLYFPLCPVYITANGE